ncbi:MAG TPA: hypothetical protein VF517_14925, partial [Thermoleophilaceae bacterium]
RERQPLARALVVDLDLGYAEFLALGYDLRATQRELVAAGLPKGAAHLAPSRARRVRRRLRALARGA